jgi:hypothetical protein
MGGLEHSSNNGRAQMFLYFFFGNLFNILCMFIHRHQDNEIEFSAKEVLEKKK